MRSAPPEAGRPGSDFRQAIQQGGSMNLPRVAGVGLAGSLGLCVAAAYGMPPVDAVTLNKIADAGFNHGEVVETAAYLADQVGGRMTNSPAMRVAERWTQGKLK